MSSAPCLRAHALSFSLSRCRRPPRAHRRHPRRGPDPTAKPLLREGHTCDGLVRSLRFKRFDGQEAMPGAVVRLLCCAVLGSALLGAADSGGLLPPAPARGGPHLCTRLRKAVADQASRPCAGLRNEDPDASLRAASAPRPARHAFCWNPAPAPAPRPAADRTRAGVCLHAEARGAGRAGPRLQPGLTRDEGTTRSPRSPARRRPRGPSPAQIQLNKRLTRCDSLDAVLTQVHAAEQSDLALTTVNLITAMHRVAKLASAGRSLQFQDALMLLERIDSELTQAAAVSMLDDRALTTLAWSLGSLYTTLSGVRPGSKLRVQSVELAERFRGTLRRIVGELQSRPLAHIPAQGLSNVAWSCAKCNLQGDASAQLLDGIAEVLQMGRPEQTWNAQDLSNLAWAYGRLRTSSDLGPQDLAALSAISTAALKLGLGRFRPQGLSNLLWAHAQLAVPCGTLSQDIYADAAASRLRGFSSQEVSNLAWAATVIDGSMPPTLCTAISEWLETSAFDRPQEVSITAWAFAKTLAPCPSLVASLRERMLDEPTWLHGFSPQAISNLVWSLAKLQALHDEDANSHDTISLVLCEVERRTLLNFKPQEISQMVHALASRGDRSVARGKALLRMFEDFVLEHGLGEFEEKHLACISWTCGLRIKRSLVGQDACEASDEASFALAATLLPSRPKRASRCVEARIETLVRREALARGLPRFMPRHLSQLLWANALADKSANDLLMAVRHELLVERNASLTDFSAAGLVHVAWAFARMLGQPSQLGADLALLIGEELEARSFDTLPPRYVSTLLWSMARLGADSPRVLGSAHKWLAESDLAMLSAQSLVMSVWAMSTVSQVSEESLARVEQEMLRRGLEEFQPQELNAAVFAFSK